MEIGIIGLGRMGRSLARQAIDKGHRVLGYNRTQRVTDELAREGLDPARSIEELVSKLATPRIILIYLPHGEPTKRACQALQPLSSKTWLWTTKALSSSVCPALGIS
jgi:6-phosphogluconate dehydrogenase